MAYKVVHSCLHCKELQLISKHAYVCQGNYPLLNSECACIHELAYCFSFVIVGSTTRLGARGQELTLLCGFNQYALLQNRDNS